MVALTDCLSVLALECNILDSYQPRSPGVVYLAQTCFHRISGRWDSLRCQQLALAIKRLIEVKSQTTTSSGGLKKPYKGILLAALKGRYRKPVTWLPLERVNHSPSSTPPFAFLYTSLLFFRLYCLLFPHNTLSPRILYLPVL